MTMKQILALTAAAALVLTMTACGSKTPETPETTAADTTVAETVEATTEAAQTTEAVSESSTQEVSTEEAKTEAAEETQAPEETTEADAKKTPETKAEIVDFYKAAAGKTGKINAHDTMTLLSLDGGSGLVGGLISLFEPIAKNTLAKNSGSVEEITGGYQNLSADDVVSATAKDDGKVTSVRINLQDQTDVMNGKSKEGHVGHGVTILDGVQSAIDQLDGVTVDASEGTIKLHYNSAYIDVKIDDATGKIISGQWHYKVDISIVNVKAKIGPVSATLKDATGAVEYTVDM